ncbi:hypothetical protein BaRGS_00010048, partial [Batillaria attramentaria]
SIVVSAYSVWQSLYAMVNGVFFRHISKLEGPRATYTLTHSAVTVTHPQGLVNTSV